MLLRMPARDPDADLVEICTALSNPMRLQIMGWLKEPARHFDPQPDPVDEVGVCLKQIQEKAGVSQSTASQYMQTLQRAGLITSERHGPWTYYRRADTRIASVTDLLHAAI
jgi:ArsR family transcriptional regulator